MLLESGDISEFVMLGLLIALQLNIHWIPTVYAGMSEKALLLIIVIIFSVSKDAPGYQCKYLSLNQFNSCCTYC
jgi:hypothetical protein